MTGDPQWLVCGCHYIGDFPQDCPIHGRQYSRQTWTGTTLTAWPMPQRLADEDIERIAQRVAELLSKREVTIQYGKGFAGDSNRQRQARAKKIVAGKDKK